MDYEQALKDPTSVFAHPDEVCEADGLSDEQKIRILKRWEYDARELEVAADENMAGGPPGLLGQVLAALHRCGGEIDTDQGSPTKQGGE